MNEKKKHYYIDCVHIAEANQGQPASPPSYLRVGMAALLVLAHLADRVADLVLAVEENTAASMYPDPNE